MAVFEEAKRLWHVAPPTEDGLCREQSSKAWARHSSSFEGLLGSVSIDVSIRFNRLAVELRPEQYGRVAFVVSDGRSLARSQEEQETGMPSRVLAQAPGALAPVSRQPREYSRAEICRQSLLLCAGAISLLQPRPANASVPTPAVRAPPATAPPSVGSIARLDTLRDCSLAVSIYPTFSYNALGGGGRGRVVAVDGDVLTVEFDAGSLSIPPIDYRSTKVVGVPIPPPLRIEILPKQLKGTVNVRTGEANLDFDARFQFDAGSLYHAAPLSIVTKLSSEGSAGRMLRGPGERLQDGKVKLAGVAAVPKTGDAFLDGFLMLPSEALAVLSAEIQFDV